MSRHGKPPPRPARIPAYRRAFDRFDEALAKNTKSDYSEKIQLLRIAMFGDIDNDEPQEPKTAGVPQ